MPECHTFVKQQKTAWHLLLSSAWICFVSNIYGYFPLNPIKYENMVIKLKLCCWTYPTQTTFQETLKCFSLSKEGNPVLSYNSIFASEWYA